MKRDPSRLGSHKEMVSKSTSFATRPNSIPHAKRNLFRNYVLKPLVVAAFVVTVNVATPNPASAVLRPKNPPTVQIIADTDSTLAIDRAGLAEMPMASQPKIDSALAQIETMKKTLVDSCPHLLRAWVRGRTLNGLDSSLSIQFVNQARFDELDGGGEAVKSDEFGKISINVQRFDVRSSTHLAELSFALSNSFAASPTFDGGFNQMTPFGDRAANSLVPSLLSLALHSEKAGVSPMMDDDPIPLDPPSACLIWFAHEMGPLSFVNAYCSGDITPLQAAYDKQFGAGQFDRLVYFGGIDSETRSQRFMENLRHSPKYPRYLESIRSMASSLGMTMDPGF